MFSIKTGTAAAACRPDPIREKGVLKSPRAFQNPFFTDGVGAASGSCRAGLDGKHCRSLFYLFYHE